MAAKDSISDALDGVAEALKKYSENKAKGSLISVPWTTLTFFVFLYMKLTNHIDWSWWYVTMPLWITFAIVVGVLAVIAAVGLLVFLGAVVYVWWDERRTYKNRKLRF